MVCIIECLNCADPVTVGADGVVTGLFDCVIVLTQLMQISMFLCVKYSLMFQMCLA